jgi:rhodanese-related sulfurtransferase
MKMEAERITVRELMEKMEHGERLQVLDVRNRIDYMKSDAALPGAIRVPANRLAEHLGGLDPTVETVTYCT